MHRSLQQTENTLRVPDPQHGAVPQRTVMLVDDESTLRSALRRFFSRRGWRVLEAEDGKQAETLLLDEIAGGGEIHVVITDMRMPRMSGMELHERIASAHPSVARRFVFSSGDTASAVAMALVDRVRCPIIEKPFDLADLLSIVEQVADGSTQTN